MTDVSVVIPTTAEGSRATSLRRAIESVRGQTGVCTQIIVVVNGSRRDTGVLQWLAGAGVRTMSIEEGSLPLALHAGRLEVASGCFAFLDDDDYLLPGTLVDRIRRLAATGADFLVSDGLRPNGLRVIGDFERIERDPLSALVTANWLTSCGGLYCTDRVDSSHFSRLAKYLEWTSLALRLLEAGLKVAFLPEITFQISDTEGSASKNRCLEFALNAVEICESLHLRVPRECQRQAALNLAAAYHEVSQLCLREGNVGQSWQMHLASLRRGGWKYLSFTRHLLQPALSPYRSAWTYSNHLD